MVTFFRASPSPTRVPRAVRPPKRRQLKKPNELPHPNKLPGIFGECRAWAWAWAAAYFPGRIPKPLSLWSGPGREVGWSQEQCSEESGSMG
jgi:hypothetical protein